MKRILLFLAFLSVIPSSMLRAAEAPNANGPTQEQLLALVKDVQSQQTTMAENQTKIDEKLVAIAEAVRVARLYSSRGGR